MTSWTKELDEAAELATKSGYYHVVLFYILCGLAAIPTSFLVFTQVFTNATPEHWCAPPPELEVLSLPEDLLKNLTIPQLDGTFESCYSFSVDPRALYTALNEYVDERSEFVRDSGTLKLVKTRKLIVANGDEERKQQIDRVTEAVFSVRSIDPIACPNGWKFSNEHYKRTLVTEYSLVCDKEWVPRLCNTLFWVGSLFGNLFFGWMSDRYGRRPTILLMIFVEVPLTIAASFPGSYWTYVALRIAGGLFFPALYQQPFILALELMPPKSRTHAGIVVGMLFASGMCILALLAYLLRDWFYLSLATSLPFILLYGLIWIIPESPRWLVSRGRVGEAEKVFRNIGLKNGVKLQRGFLLEIHKKIKEEEEQSEYEAMILSSVNGNIVRTDDILNNDKMERRLSNMLTFKPELSKISESNETLKTNQREKPESLERIIALEVAEIVNRKSRIKSESDSIREENEKEEAELHTEESQLNDIVQKSTQGELYPKSPANTLRRKSIQLVTRIVFNKEDNEEEILENRKIDEQNSEGDCKASPLDIFRYPNMRKKFFILTFDWVALGVVYNGLSYNTPNLGIDDYLAFFIGGAVEIPSYFIAWRCMERWGRRWVLCLNMCIGGAACLSCVAVPEAWPWITVSLAMLGRLCAAASFAVFYVLIGELLPTVVRAQAMGASSVISGLGLLSCPYIVYLSVYFRALPLTIMGILSVAGGITSLFLPETLNQPLPQTLGDGEAFGRDFKILSCVTPPKK